MARILLLDDSPLTPQLVQGLRAEAGHGIAQLMNQRFDMLVPDIYMPGADGIQIIRECRRLQPTVKIVAISGRGGPLGYALRRPDIAGLVQFASRPPVNL